MYYVMWFCRCVTIGCLIYTFQQGFMLKPFNIIPPIIAVIFGYSFMGDVS